MQNISCLCLHPFLRFLFPGLKEKCVDSLVFETLIPKPMMQHYISLLLKHRRLILSGPSGTGKTYLASRLAEYLVDRSAREVSDGIVVTFNMHRQSCKVRGKMVTWPVSFFKLAFPQKKRYLYSLPLGPPAVSFEPGQSNRSRIQLVRKSSGHYRGRYSRSGYSQRIGQRSADMQISQMVIYAQNDIKKNKT